MTLMEKVCFYLGIGAALVILGMIFFSTKGVMDYRDLVQKEARIKSQVEVEERQNLKLEKEIRRMKQDLDYIRHLAKHEYGMADPDEVIFKHRQQENRPAEPAKIPKDKGISQ